MDDIGLPVDLSTTFRLYSVWLGCLQELFSWGGLWGGTSTLVYDIKERLEDLWAEHLFLPFSLWRTAPPPRLETALVYSTVTVTVYHIDTWSLTSHVNQAVQAWSQLIFWSFSTNLYLCKTSSSNHPLVAQNFCTSLCYWVVQHIWKWTSRLWYKLVKYLNVSNLKSYKPKWPSNQEMICGWNTGIIRSV